MQYGFRTRASDKEIDSVLLSLQGKERSEFIREALSFYIKFKDTLDSINSNIADIKETLNDLKKSGISVKENLKEPEQEPVKKDNEDIFKEMMNDFLNL
ncbi:MAG: hypothetical protein PWR08_1730 [Thermoanaerobacterium sp.]|uniref:Metal-responsive CopG/Arc/MetJ family transcriptional regulator n=1 Tax=Thermoanaerobacterium butyriciformans TaxID=1702242 RepID=A0ABS4NAW2_9THEO|nr:hypothetical protein [Thermoanaerobacterium butyriciformans]MBP2070801.1 metal-responsive CopG/Arc/MetJ family transcriptional regulator [Thermoanaerobacterium butyriciformans]MDN5317605.1 hypothetical protein [Thermoanaerobacterium sp.]